MSSTTTYEALVALTRNLAPGDELTVGPDAVSPTMVAVLADLSLTTTVTVATHAIIDAPPTVTISGTSDLLGLSTLFTELTFFPVGAEPSGPFNVAIKASPAPGTEWGLVSGFVFSRPSVAFVPNRDVEVFTAELDCDILIGSARSLTLPVKVRVPSYPGLEWVIAGTFASHPLTLDAFSSLAGGLVLSEYLPAPLDTLARFGVSELEIAYLPASGISRVRMVVAYSQAWSALGIIDVPAGGVSLEFMVDFHDSAQNFVTLEARFDLAGVPFDIGAHFAPGNFYVWGKLEDGRTAAIADVFEHFQVALPSGFPAIQVDKLSLLANLSQGQYSFDLAAQVDVHSALKVRDLAASVAVTTTPSTKVVADFHGTIVINKATTLFLGASYDGGGGGLTLAGSAADVPMGDLIAYWASEFGIAASQIPEPICTLHLKTLTVSYNTSTGDFLFSCDGDFKVYDTPVGVTFAVSIIHPTSPVAATLPDEAVTGDKGYSATFGGSVMFAGNRFDIRFNAKDTGRRIFVADYQQKGGGEVSLRDLVASISQPLADPIPGDIVIGLDVVKFAYLGDAGAAGAGGTNRFLFGVELGAKIGLTDIPLIGDKLPADLQVEFDQLQFVYARPGFDKAQAADINAILPVGVGPIPDDGLVEGVLISSILKLGDKSQTLSLTIPTGSPDTVATPANLPAVADTAAAPASVSINVQKQFGPVGIRKLGLTYADGRLFAVGDISLDAQILRIGLIDLGIGSRINQFDPAVRLSGLTIVVEQGPISVSGGLYGTIDPLNFNGGLQVNLPSMSIGALGGYAQLGSDPSFFMYVSVNRPLFGYPFFYLDGIAGGLGFNRDLMIPGIDEVADFPLVAWATGNNPPGVNPNGDIGSQIQRVVGALASDIPPKVGQYWVAAGIKFSSFKVLDSFALVTVVFGTEFKFALLGLTTASLPPRTEAGVQPLAFVQMALRASFSPQTGILEIEAKLTPASFILDQKCSLTGGFAYYMWFKDNPSGAADGYHAGDFVVTLGGYHPAFTAPGYFPKVPRLGFNWRVDGHTTIQGGIYFALTPSALMAGGALEAVWKSGDLKAWFTAHADFLLSWKPFHYEASIGLSIGASYKLDLLFTSVTITIHLGVRLQLWGPPFGGSIYVDLSVISFTVSIGNSDKPRPQPISWADFKTSFLPRDTARHALALTPGTSVETDSYCLASVASGMIKDLSDVNGRPGDPDWVVSAEKLEIVTMSALPSKSATLTTAAAGTVSLPIGGTGFGVGPVGVSVADFTSRHAITLNRLVGGVPDPAFDVTEAASIELATSNLPSATWGGHLIVNPSISEINRTPANIAGLAVGYSIKSKPTAPDHTPLPIAVDILQQDNEGTVGFSWSTPTVPTTDPFDQSKAMKTFQETLTSTAGPRSAIISAINHPGLALGVDADVDIDELARSADTVLLHAPMLAYLGEERAE